MDPISNLQGTGFARIDAGHPPRIRSCRKETRQNVQGPLSAILHWHDQEPSMPVPASRNTQEMSGGALRPGSLRSLPLRTYRFRVLGMGLALLPVAATLHELQAHWAIWAWAVFGGLLWPHLAFLAARRSQDPFHAELRNFVFDSAIAGSWVPLMHFNLLPSAVLLTVVTADKVNSGIRGLWLRSLPGMAGAVIGGGLLTGFAWQPQTSMLVVLASLPLLVIHTLAVSLSSYKLVRRVQRQNVQLEELSRTDALTGLDSRRHWETQADALLQQHHDVGQRATLLLVDVDHFKAINDRYGHAVGDDVLCAIAGLMRDVLGSDSHAGRLGGDEFVAALPVSAAEAAEAAERLRTAVEGLEFGRQPGLRLSISTGLAAASDGTLDLREWIEAADRALYAAKRAGRNRTAGGDRVGTDAGVRQEG
jgi:diguanylate cyclase